MAGVNLLEAGETNNGWWVYLEAGGIGPIRELVKIECVTGKPRIISRKYMQ